MDNKKKEVITQEMADKWVNNLMTKKHRYSWGGEVRNAKGSDRSLFQGKYGQVIYVILGIIAFALFVYLYFWVYSYWYLNLGRS